MYRNVKYIFRSAIPLVLLYCITVGFTTSNYQDSVAQYSAAGNYAKAKAFLNKSRSQALEGDDSLHVEWLIKHAQLTSILGENDSALFSLLHAIKLSDSINSKPLYIKAKVQEIEFNRKLRKYPLSKRIIYELQDEEIKDSLVLCRLYHRAAAVYNEMHYGDSDPKTLDSARVYSEMALDLAKRLNNLNAQATCHNELGDIYEKMNDKELSYKNYREAVKMWEEVDHYNQLNSMKNLAEYFNNNESYDSAIFYYNHILDTLKNSKHFDLLSGVHGGLKTTYFSLGDSLKGYKNSASQSRNFALETNQLAENRINELYLELETEKKEQEIIQKRLQLKQNERQFNYFAIIGMLLLVVVVALIYSTYLSKQKNIKLKKLNEENQFLIGETNHRVKNNLQLIISLIGREMYKNKGEVPYLEHLSDKINAIASLHQQLYLNESIRAISVKAYICDIYENLKESMMLSDFNLEMDIEDTELPSEKATYLGLLVTELITNTAKHAYDRGEEKLIGLKICNDEQTLTLNYFDNGKGVPKGVKLKLIDILVKQLEGEIIPDPHAGINGYSIQLKFKI